ncbi:MAG: hypothetical protein AB1728_02750 [Bacteroidota bacterium]
MQIETDKYYHIYNRSNNREIAYRSSENYNYFLGKYKKYVSPYVDTIAYCLMPTHFHFLVRVVTEEIDVLRNNIGVLLSSYTKAINKQYNRNGSLFQRHTKAVVVDDESYLLTLIMYIHQNPIRAGLIDYQEDWKFSSYQDYSGLHQAGIVKKGLMMRYFNTSQVFNKFSEELLNEVKKQYWV